MFKYIIILLYVSLSFITFSQENENSKKVYTMTANAGPNGYKRVFDANYRLGYVNSEGIEIIKPQYIQGTNFTNGIAFVSKSSGTLNFGVINEKNEILLPFEYETVDIIENLHEFIVLKKGIKYGIYSVEKKKIILPFEYEKIEISYKYRQIYAENPIILFKKNGMFGLMDENLKIILSNIYEELYVDYDNNNLVSKKNGKFGILDLNGKTNVDFQFDDIKKHKDPIRPLIYFIKKNGKVGIMNKFGNILIPINFNEITPISKNSDSYNFIVNSNGKKGILDEKGIIVIKLEYEEIESYERVFVGNFIAKKNGKWGLVNNFNEIKIDFLYDEKFNTYTVVRNLYTYELIEIKLNGKLGLIDKNGKTILNPFYNKITFINDSLFIVTKLDKMGVFTFNNKMIIPIIYDTIRNELDENRNLIALNKKEGGYGVINLKNEIVIPFKYQSIGTNIHGNYEYRLNDKIIGVFNKRGIDIKENKNSQKVNYQIYQHFYNTGLKIVRIDNKFGMVDKNENVIFEIENEAIVPFNDSDSLFKFKRNNKWGFVTKNGFIIKEPTFEEIKYLYYNYNLKRTEFIVTENELKGIIDSNFKTIFEARFQNIETATFNYNFYKIKLNNKYGLVDYNKKEIIPPKYDAIEYFGHNIHSIKLNNKYGYIDSLGNELTKPIYEYPGENLYNFIIQKQKDKFGLVTSAGEILIPFIYTIFKKAANYEKRDFYIVSKDLLLGIIQLDNKIILPLEYDNIESLNADLCIIIKNGKKGIFSFDKSIFIPAEYNSISKLHQYNDDYFKVEKNGKYGILKKNGEILIPFLYEDFRYDIEGEMISFKLKNKWGYFNKNGTTIINPKFDSIQEFDNGICEVILNGKKVKINKKGEITI